MDYFSHRPHGYEGQGDSHLPKIVRRLRRALAETQSSFAYDTLRLPSKALGDLAGILVDFAEDSTPAPGYGRHTNATTSSSSALPFPSPPNRTSVRRRASSRPLPSLPLGLVPGTSSTVSPFRRRTRISGGSPMPPVPSCPMPSAMSPRTPA